MAEQKKNKKLKEILEEDSKIGASFFGKEPVKSKDQEADELFKKDKTDYDTLASTIKKAEVFPGRRDRRLTMEEIASFGPADQSPKAEASPDSSPKAPKTLAEKVKATVEAPKEDDLAAELKRAREAYQAAGDAVDRREAIEAIANGLGKIGAGMAGNRMGSDMSGVKFDKQDWERKRDRSQRDFQTDLSDIDSRRKQKSDEAKFDADLKLREKTLSETSRHNKQMESIYGAKAVAAGASVKSKLDAKATRDYKQNVEKVSSELYQIGQDLEKGGDEKMAMARIKSVLQSKLGVSPETAQQMVVDDGWIFDSMKDIDQIQTAVDTMAATTMAVRQMKAEVPEGHALVESADGKMGYLPQDQLSLAIKEGYKIIP